MDDSVGEERVIIQECFEVFDIKKTGIVTREQLRHIMEDLAGLDEEQMVPLPLPSHPCCCLDFWTECLLSQIELMKECDPKETGHIAYMVLPNEPAKNLSVHVCRVQDVILRLASL